jgi:hypothetical protein
MRNKEGHHEDSNESLLIDRLLRLSACGTSSHADAHSAALRAFMDSAETQDMLEVSRVPSRVERFPRMATARRARSSSDERRKMVKFEK